MGNFYGPTMSIHDEFNLPSADTECPSCVESSNEVKALHQAILECVEADCHCTCHADSEEFEHVI